MCELVQGYPKLFIYQNPNCVEDVETFTLGAILGDNSCAFYMGNQGSFVRANDDIYVSDEILNDCGIPVYDEWALNNLFFDVNSKGRLDRWVVKALRASDTQVLNDDMKAFIQLISQKGMTVEGAMEGMYNEVNREDICKLPARSLTEQQLHPAVTVFLSNLDAFLQEGFSMDQFEELTHFLWLKCYKTGMCNPDIISGFNEKLYDQLSFMARPEISHYDMMQIQDCFMKKLTIEQTSVVMTPGISSYDRRQLILGFEHGLSVEEVSSYANPNLKSYEFERARKKLEKAKLRTLDEQIHSASTREAEARAADKASVKESAPQR